MEFPVENYVMVPIKTERFPYKDVRQLQTYSVGPFKSFEMGWTKCIY